MQVLTRLRWNEDSGILKEIGIGGGNIDWSRWATGHVRNPLRHISLGILSYVFVNGKLKEVNVPRRGNL